MTSAFRTASLSRMGWKQVAIIVGGVVALAFVGRFVYVSAFAAGDARRSVEAARKADAIVQGARTAPSVSVECKEARDGFKCVLTHRSGASAARTCWDMVVECKNGSVARGNDCAWVDPGQTFSSYIVTREVKGIADCDAPVVVKTENVETQSQ